MPALGSVTALELGGDMSTEESDEVSLSLFLRPLVYEICLLTQTITHIDHRSAAKGV